jgi:hypothetical protein
MSQDPTITPNETYDPDQEKKIRPNPDEPYQPTEPDDPDVVPTVIDDEDDLEVDPDNLDTDTDVQAGDRDAGIDDYSTLGEQRNDQTRDQPQLNGDAGLGDDGLNYTGMGDTGLSDGVGGQADDEIGVDSGLSSDSALGIDLDDDEDSRSQLDESIFGAGTDNSSGNPLVQPNKTENDENYRDDR